MRALIGALLVAVVAALVGFGVGGGTNQSARHKSGDTRIDLSAFWPAGMIPAFRLIPATSDSSQADSIKQASVVMRELIR